jgi:hypothetical protein
MVSRGIKNDTYAENPIVKNLSMLVV